MADDADTLKTLKAELYAAKADPEAFTERADAVSSFAIEALRGAAAATAPSLPVAVHAMRVLKASSDARSAADASAAVQTFVDGALLRGSGGGSAPLPRAVRFVCEPTAECRSCAGEGGKERAMCGERCSFVGPTTGTRFETLHFAGKEFERDGARPTRRRPAANNASAARDACLRTAHLCPDDSPWNFALEFHGIHGIP